MAAEFVIARTFDAPRQRVWDAWTRPEQFARWFGPKGVKSTPHIFEFREGGRLHARMDSPDGNHMWALNIYREIVPIERLVWEHGFSNEQAEFAPSPFGLPWPLRLLTVVTLEDKGAQTVLTLRWKPLDASEEEIRAFTETISSMTGGWTGTFDQLDDFLREAA
ncbi:SRPBCC family protein [Sphingomonas sp. PR090111-T3T-6A]|uniref:SRPBCC family protein n=1 Tax=Sphingomonas sp. PR090111-T3T-6A TaxID=685778 RepID=UPI000A039C8A|nr:SRPBCC domain-containing protein [Sphingomonas sp. PR090111-T3T-6A]